MKLFYIFTGLVLFTSIVMAQENKLRFGFNDLSHYSQYLHMSPANVSLASPSLYNEVTGLLASAIPFRLKRSVAPHNNHRKHTEKHVTKHNGQKNSHKENNHVTTASTQNGAHDRKRHKDNDDRLSVITRITSCNYASRPGSRCLSCREAVTCFRNNRAIVRRCFFILRYCNSGRCSFIPGSKCYRVPTAATTATGTSSSTSTSTTTSTSTSTTNSTSTTTSTSTTNSTSTSTTTTSNTTSTSPSTTSTTTVSSTTSPTSTSSSSSSTSSTSSASPTTTGTSTASSTSTVSSSSTSTTTSDSSST